MNPEPTQPAGAGTPRTLEDKYLAMALTLANIADKLAEKETELTAALRRVTELESKLHEIDAATAGNPPPGGICNRIQQIIHPTRP